MHTSITALHIAVSLDEKVLYQALMTISEGLCFHLFSYKKMWRAAIGVLVLESY